MVSAARISRPMLGAGLFYALFSALLYAGGHQPSFTGLPLPAEHYYLAQSLFVVPLLLSGAWLFARITRSLAGAPQEQANALSLALGRAYAWPLIALYLTPDLVVYLWSGFEALAPAMRIYAPLCLIAILALGTRSVGRLCGVSVGRALAATLVGFLTQAVWVALFLR